MTSSLGKRPRAEEHTPSRPSPYSSARPAPFHSASVNPSPPPSPLARPLPPPPPRFDAAPSSSSISRDAPPRASFPRTPSVTDRQAWPAHRQSRKPKRASFAPPAEKETPCKRNSESVREHAHNVEGARADPSKTRRSEMDLLLYDELYGKVAFGVGDMWRSFPVTESARAMLQYAIERRLYDPGAGWTAWPANPTEPKVLGFLLELLSALRAASVWPSAVDTFEYVPAGSVVLDDGDCERKTDVVVVGPHHDGQRDLSWLDVRIVGELKSNPAKSNLDDTILQVANYAREVFGCQPNRRWVPAFTLCGSDLRVWRFDRAGACGSSLINIHDEPGQFLATITSYATMSAADVGFDPSILFQTETGEVVFDPTVHCSLAAPPADDDADMPDVVPAPDSQGDEENPECQPAANDRLPTPLDSYPYVYVPAAIPEFPAATEGLTLPHGSLSSFPCTAWTALSLHPEPISRRIAIATRGSVCWKARPREEGPGSPWLYVVKDQWRSFERDPEGCFLGLAEEGTEGVARYIWHSDLCVPLSAGRLHLDEIANLRPASAVSTCFNAAAAAQYPAPTKTSTNLFHAGHTCDNRVHTRLLSGPVGRPLLQFGTYTNLLLCLKQAIEGHRYMYTKHGVLHRDVSKNNILLHPATPGGFLIDFDLAIFNDRTRTSGAAHRTGTFDFMALDVLLPRPGLVHTPLHDLESFFYVLLWIGIYYTKSGQRRDPPPRHTIFKPPAPGEAEPWQAARNNKTTHTLPANFKIFVLPTLEPGARECLSGTLNAWRRVMFSFLYADEEEEGSGGGVTEEVIAQRYREVIAILEKGIAELAADLYIFVTFTGDNESKSRGLISTRDDHQSLIKECSKDMHRSTVVSWMRRYRLVT
ncbi:hypothetical protein FN846DRAFT_921955 [Sphaerosporella brunnea]|uniref:non-specific serine/threonine protein kinase n=1 Tax=Sphaerosporella brunnea TaxID=1250544 RepID=A0A5J5EJZ3_9PEZI|nr:hypothetical protein FN846DRAFT_921955 [Sphaerosporella brunnea]